MTQSSTKGRDFGAQHTLPEIAVDPAQAANRLYAASDCSRALAHTARKKLLEMADEGNWSKLPLYCQSLLGTAVLSRASVTEITEELWRRASAEGELDAVVQLLQLELGINPESQELHQRILEYRRAIEVLSALDSGTVLNDFTPELSLIKHLVEARQDELRTLLAKQSVDITNAGKLYMGVAACLEKLIPGSEFNLEDLEKSGYLSKYHLRYLVLTCMQRGIVTHVRPINSSSENGNSNASA